MKSLLELFWIVLRKKKGIRKTFVITQQKSKTKNKKKGGCCDK